MSNQVKAFLKNTPRLNPESGVVFAERLVKFEKEVELSIIKRLLAEFSNRTIEKQLILLRNGIVNVPILFEAQEIRDVVEGV